MHDLDRNLGGADVLRDSSRFPSSDGAPSDCIQQGGFAVVDVTQNAYYRLADCHVVRRP
jgi:hypothetical protein